MQRQKIRPSYADLLELETESDLENDQSSSDDETPQYAPAATPIRGVAPPVLTVKQIKSSKVHISNGGSSSRVSSQPTAPTKAKKTVRISSAPSTSKEEVSYPSALGRTAQLRKIRRPAAGEDAAHSTDKTGSVQTEDGGIGPAPLIGAIQERASITPRHASAGSAVKKKVSKFAQSRANEKSAIEAPQSEESKMQQVEEKWLDEDGEPMSAFRKSRMTRLGQRPPAIAPSKPAVVQSQSVPQSEKSTQDTSILPLLSSISAENEKMLSDMSSDHVQRELQELHEVFGTDLLERLKKRKDGKISSIDEPISTNPSRSKAVARQSPSASYSQAHELHADVTADSAPIDDQDGAVQEEGFAATFRFDFSGLCLSHILSLEGDTELQGLHHHGDEQNRAGYTTNELLHLARSTLPSQRALALQTLERVLLQYPEMYTCGMENNSASLRVAREIGEKQIRGKTGVVASWYIENRQIGVQLAAMRALRASLFTSLPGSKPFSCVDLARRDCEERQTKERKAEAYSVLSDQFALMLLPSLSNILAQGNSLSRDTRETALDILIFLSGRSVEVCSFLARQQKCITMVVETCIVQAPWPAGAENGRDTILTLKELLILVFSQRENAKLLIEKGCIEPLLRFVALPPWQLEETGDADDTWVRYDLTMQIYAALGTYGLYTDMLRRAYSLIDPLLSWIGGFRRTIQSADNELCALRSSLTLLSTWTVCAIDSHQTESHHAIGWSHVTDWWQPALHCLLRLAQWEFLEGSVLGVLASAEAVTLLDHWVLCARQHNQLGNGSLPKELTSATGYIVALAESLCKFIGHISHHFPSDGGDKVLGLSLIALQREIASLAALCEGAVKVYHYVQRHTQSSTSLLLSRLFQKEARSLLQSTVWCALDRMDARQAGFARPRRSIVSFCLAATETYKGEDSSTGILSALSVLQAGDEREALHLLQCVLPSNASPILANDLLVLGPFINEMLLARRAIAVAPFVTTPASLSVTQTLFVGATSIQEDSKEELDVDPISGVDLWRSPASGLPLRADWPLASLDDLLRSGTCASLNRKGALEGDWDANERQIVLSSLRLGLHLWGPISQRKERAGCLLPSAAEVHLGIIKVFLLEDEEGQKGKGSGLITGKDIYRDREVADLIGKLFHLSRQLPSEHDGSAENLERVTHRQLGSSLPFYQLYTTLIGLYDADSYGMELFGRVLLLPQAQTYSADYKRLLWVDYAHCLPTFSTRLKDSPYPLLMSFCSEEESEDVVAAMAGALLCGTVTEDRSDLLYLIAVQQVAHHMWNFDGENITRARLSRTIFCSSPSPVSHKVQIAVKDFGLPDGDDRLKELLRRDYLLEKALSGSLDDA